MLELTRRLYKHGAEESAQRDRIVIITPTGEKVTMFLSEIKSQTQATISFEFPSTVQVWRGELWDKMRKEKKDAN